jgi:hypothetical protein
MSLKGSGSAVSQLRDTKEFASETILVLIWVENGNSRKVGKIEVSHLNKIEYKCYNIVIYVLYNL